MENLHVASDPHLIQKFHFHCKFASTPSRTLIPSKPKIKFPRIVPQSCLSTSYSSPPFQISNTKHRTLLVEKYHEHHTLKTLLQNLEKEGSNPLEILTADGDWCKDHFWAVIKFLKNASRSYQILQVFDMWKNVEKSRVNESNYEKIIEILSEQCMMEDAVSALRDMKIHGLRPSLGTYNPIIHGFAKEGNFVDALHFLSVMKEVNVVPDTDTYDGLIQAYGKFKMYDEIGMCVKKMKLDGCPADHITCNLLIQEYARGGLLQRMEKVYQRMVSKRLRFQSSTLIAMLEAYARFGIVEKMEKLYRRVLNSNIPIKDELIRTLAEVYIENYMFSRLEDLGIDLYSASGRSNLVWCLRLLSYACLMSRKGMDIVVREMHDANIFWNVTFANIIMLSYLKMKDFKHMRILLSQLPALRVKPDIVTVGILFDAKRIGFDGSGTLESWRRVGFIFRPVEMKTDPLVLSAFGKGHFLKGCEEMYSSLHPEDRGRRSWTYRTLIDNMSRHTSI